jgi:HSP20 family protein
MVDSETIDTEFSEKEEKIEDKINEEKSKFDERSVKNMVDSETIDTEFSEKEEKIEDKINEEKSKFDEKKRRN